MEKTKECAIVGSTNGNQKMQLQQWKFDESSGVVIFFPSHEKSEVEKVPHRFYRLSKNSNVSGYLLVVQLPGVSRDKIDIKFSPPILTLTATVPDHLDGKQENFKLFGTSFLSGVQQLVLTLPQDCNQDKGSWKSEPSKQDFLKDPSLWTGILKITFPVSGEEDVDL